MGRRHAQALAVKTTAATLAATPPCLLCGQRLGKHRYGDDACPNTRWSAGNGQPQWKTTTYREAALAPSWP